MRTQLLKTVLVNSEDQVASKIQLIIKKDEKFLEREIFKIEQHLEDAYSDLEDRLSLEEVIDNSVVESLWGNIKTLEEKLNLYKTFSDYYSK